MSYGSNKLNDLKGIRSRDEEKYDFARLENSARKELEWVEKVVVILVDNKIPAVSEYIYYCLARIKATADKLYLALRHPGAGTFNIPALESSLAELLKTYVFIESHFAERLPADYNLPLAYLNHAFPCLIRAAREIINSLSNGVLKSDLSDAVVAYLNNSINSKSGISRHQLNYLRVFQEKLDQFISSPFTTKPDVRFAETLRTLNFNNLALLSWFQNEIYTKLDKVNILSDRLYLIAAELESLRRLPPAMPEPCYKDQPAVHVFLKNLLEEEFRQQIISGAVISPLRQLKLHLNLSVAQIAFLLCLIHNEGIFKNSCVTEILRFAVASFCSKRQDDFSFRNISKEYYSISQVTAATLRDILLRMIAYINKHYFPIIAAAGLANYIF